MRKSKEKRLAEAKDLRRLGALIKALNAEAPGLQQMEETAVKRALELIAGPEDFGLICEAFQTQSGTHLLIRAYAEKTPLDIDLAYSLAKRTLSDNFGGKEAKNVIFQKVLPLIAPNNDTNPSLLFGMAGILEMGLADEEANRAIINQKAAEIAEVMLSCLCKENAVIAGVLANQFPEGTGKNILLKKYLERFGVSDAASAEIIRELIEGGANEFETQDALREAVKKGGFWEKVYGDCKCILCKIYLIEDSEIRARTKTDYLRFREMLSKDIRENALPDSMEQMIEKYGLSPEMGGLIKESEPQVSKMIIAETLSQALNKGGPEGSGLQMKELFRSPSGNLRILSGSLG